ncbi:MAG: hypothetical protein ACK4YP_11200 [Myxococcota bacterium]
MGRADPGRGLLWTAGAAALVSAAIGLLGYGMMGVIAGGSI